MDRIKIESNNPAVGNGNALAGGEVHRAAGRGERSVIGVHGLDIIFVSHRICRTVKIRGPGAGAGEWKIPAEVDGVVYQSVSDLGCGHAGGIHLKPPRRAKD